MITNNWLENSFKAANKISDSPGIITPTTSHSPQHITFLVFLNRILTPHKQVFYSSILQNIEILFSEEKASLQKYSLPATGLSNSFTLTVVHAHVKKKKKLERGKIPNPIGIKNKKALYSKNIGWLT